MFIYKTKLFHPHIWVHYTIYSSLHSKRKQRYTINFVNFYLSSKYMRRWKTSQISSRIWKHSNNV